MQNKDFAVLFYEGMFIAFSGGLQRTQSPKEVVTSTDAAGAPIARHNAGNEDTLTGTPTGFLTGARIEVLYPYATGIIKRMQNAAANRHAVLYQFGGTRTTFYSFGVKKEPTMNIGVGKDNFFGSMEFFAITASGGDWDGELDFVEYGAEFPEMTWLNAEEVFHGAPLVSWYANRTTGADVAVVTLNNNEDPFTEGSVTTIDGIGYVAKASPTAAHHFYRGTSCEVALANLKKCINNTGTPGSEIGVGNTRHPTVRATTLTSTSLLIEAKVPGTKGNDIAVTTNDASLAFSTAKLTGGVDAEANTNAVGYDGAEPGWYHIETSDGVTVNPTVELGAINSGRFGIHGYTVDAVGANVVFQPVSLSEKAFNAAKNRTPGTKIMKGDVKIEAGALTVRLTAGSFAGGQLEYSNKNLLISPVTIQGNSAQAGGTVLPVLDIRYVED
jgi:hypothetical protein